MTNTVLLKRSNTANAVPLAGNLTAGELALNYTDGNLFYKNNAGVVTLLASNQQMSVFGNITGGNLITSGLVTATGNITGGNLLTAGIVSATGNITGKYFLGNANIQYTASTAPTTGNLIGAQWYNTSTDTLYEWQTDGTTNYWVDVTGPVIGATGGATGNVIVNGTSNVTIPVANGNAGINIGGTANVAIFATTGEYVTGVVSATGNITGGNLLTGGLISATANITGGNITTGGLITATGNITAVANIAGGNITTAGIISSTGNITAVANISGGNMLTAGIMSSTGNAIHGNISTAGLITATGNITSVANISGGNIIGTHVGNVTGTTASLSGNVTGGNILTSGLISATGNLTVGNLTTTIANVTTFNSSQGGNVTGTLVATSANAQFINQTNGAGYATVAGYLSVAGNVTGGNILTGGLISATGNITGGNISTAGLITATGNITAVANISGGNILTAGIMSSTGNAIHGNISTAGLITATGNITAVANVAGGNILTAGIMSSTGNVIGGNIVTGGLITATGNIVAAANITGGNILTAGIMSSTGNASHGNLTVTGFGTITYAPASVTGYALQLNAANTVGGTGYGDFLRATNTSTGATNPNKSFRVNNVGAMELLNSAYTSVLLSVSDGGALTIPNTAATANNDPTTNYLGFNSNNAVIYDDGNFHIHARGNGSNMWINSSNAAIIIGNQSTVAGGSPATGVIMGSSAAVKAYLSVYGSKTYAIGTYGYLATSGAGTGASTTASYSIYSDNRMNASEFDATSDERAKNIQGTIPLDQALKFVRRVDGLLYTWNDLAVDNDPGLKAGFSAQRVHKAGFDHMIGVVENEKMQEQVDEDGWVHPAGHQLTMGYNQAVPYHHEVIKHLLDRIEQLEATVAKLTNK